MKSRIWCRPLALLPVLLWAANAGAGPLYDPFLERFQVGQYADPEQVALREGFPADLLEPSVVDTVWAETALQVMSDPVVSTAAVRRLLGALPTGLRREDERARIETALRALTSAQTRAGLPDLGASDFLGPELEALRVQDALAAGDPARAAERAGRLARLPGLTEWNERAAFVWELRARALAAAAGTASGFPGVFWNTMLDLGPYDSGNAWALWTRCARAAGTPLLPAEAIGPRTERFLAGLGNGWLQPQEIYGSGFDAEAQASLGAQLLKGQELRDHIARFAAPPRDFDRQGNWVKGARYARRGQVAPYEELARRTDLAAGWRMDLWRRASELRFLDGQHAQGLADLKQALDLAANDGGTLALRRRLRQWCEQALVLALARGDTLLARDIHGLGDASFHGEEADAYRSETAYWRRLWEGGEVRPAPEGEVERAKRTVETGGAPALRAPVLADLVRFVAAADRSRWGAWVRWGRWLAAESAGADSSSAAGYLALLPAGEPTEASYDQECRLAALACAAERLADGPAWPALVRAAIESDVARRRPDRGPNAESAVPDALPAARGSRLDLHALLGFCLALDDLRGVLGVAYELPARGLDENEKLRFLYPLPGPGSLRDAIVASGAEPALVLAIARNESLFEPNVRSRAGALGFMQIMPFHYERRGAVPGAGHWSCPEVSIARAGRILADDGRRYDGDPYLTVAAYNAGPGAAARWLEQLGGIAGRDAYLAWIGFPETRRYVEKVLLDREIYDWIIASDAAARADEDTTPDR